MTETGPPDPTDPYGVDLLLGPTGDLVAGSHGGLIHVQGPTNVGQAVSLRLRTFPGELPLHPDYGAALEQRLVGAKQDVVLARAETNRQARAVIEADRRTLAARDVTAAIDGVQLVVAMVLVLAGGEQLTTRAAARVDELHLDVTVDADPHDPDPLDDSVIDAPYIDFDDDDFGEADEDALLA